MHLTRMQVGTMLDAVPRQTKIKRSAYQKSGCYPIIDQSQADIAGYTDDESCLYQGALPVVIFGDHTRVLKFVNFPFCVGADGTQLLRPVPGNDIRYFYYALRNVDLTNYGYERHFKYLKEEEIDLPLPPIQQRIAGILSAYDDLIENSQRRIKILEEMARSLYREWFVNFRYPGHESVPLVPSSLGEIPQGWVVSKLGDISSYINRGITPRYDEGGDSVVINQKCVRDQRVSLEPARRQSKEIPHDKRVCFGDVLINSTGVGTLGRVAQVYEDLKNCTVDTHVTIARAGKNTDLDFYGCCLLSLQETFERLGVGATGQTELGRAAIAEIKLVAPPIDLQLQFGVVVKGIRSAAVTYGEQIQNLRLTRDLLLPRLLSGQIDVEAMAV